MFDTLLNPNWLAILVAGVGAMVVGMVWYSPAVFGNKWAKLEGMSEAKMAENKKKGMGGMAKQLIAMFVSALIGAVILAFVLKALSVSSVDNAILVAILVWLGFSVPSTISDWLFGGKSFQLFSLKTLETLVTFVVMGIILTLWM